MKWIRLGLVILLLSILFICLGAKGCLGGGHSSHTGSSSPWQSMTMDGVPSLRYFYSTVWTGNEMIVWGGHLFPGSEATNTGFKYNPVSDTWTSIITIDAPISRYEHTAIWTGNEMIVWGGRDKDANKLNTGAKYYPITDTWVSITTTDAPTSRTFHTAIWTGQEMIVWGGLEYTFLDINTGAKYYPITDTWVAITTNGAPAGRKSHTAIWTDTEMIIFAGADGGPLSDGARYNPGSDTWAPMADSPVAGSGHTAIWTGTELIVWGDGGAHKYNPPPIDTWTPINQSGAPTQRYEHTAVWTGNEMIIWGGYYATTHFNNGGRYNPATDTWILIPSISLLESREEHTAIWTGTPAQGGTGEMIIWGGVNLDLPAYFNTGGRYKP